MSVACDSYCLLCGPKIIEESFEVLLGLVLLHMVALDGGIGASKCWWLASSQSVQHSDVYIMITMRTTPGIIYVH